MDQTFTTTPADPCRCERDLPKHAGTWVTVTCRHGRSWVNTFAAWGNLTNRLALTDWTRLHNWSWYLRLTARSQSVTLPKTAARKEA